MKVNILIGAFLWVGLLLFPATAHAQDACPAIPADGPGVQRIEGQGSYTFYGLPTIIVDQPVITMVDDGLAAQGDLDTFPPSNGQVIGGLTSDFFTSPFSFTVNLPAEGIGLQVDLDQDGETNTGVQVYQVALNQNVLNTVPLVGIAQGPMLSSYYRDVVTDEIVAGALVVYASDDQQGFPCGYGADGKLFTADDPIATLPSGFTVANIADGAITFDRSEVAHIDISEGPGVATLNFSDQGFVGSFNALIDFLRERYVFNQFDGFNDVDWEELRATYLPRVEAAEANANLGEFYLALLDLAHDVFDAHVYVDYTPILLNANDPVAKQTLIAGVERVKGGVGAKLVELGDGRIIVTEVAPAGPAAAAGFVFGTEIVSVNGVAVEEALAQPVRTLDFPGTEESRRIIRVDYLLKWPIGTEVEVGYQLPDATEVMTTTLTSVADLPAVPDTSAMPMTYDLIDGVGYVTWPGFRRTGIATHIFADFIKVMVQQQIPGIIIDMRSNGGGSGLMEFAVLSYLFGEDNPLSMGIVDSYSYNELGGEFVRAPKTLELSNPPASQPYLGDVVVLVDQNCASACEFMSYWLQASGRATIVGHYATEGAGGNTNAVILAGNLQFNYTAGTDVDPATDEPTFQSVGVQPDIRVPVTEESERKKLDGGDPILDAGIEHLRRLAFERLGHEPATFISATVTSEVPTGWRPSADGTGYTSPDDPITLSITTPTESAETNPDALMAATYPEVEKAGEVETDLGTWSIYGAEIEDTFNVYGVIIIDDQPYIVTTTTTDEQLVALMVEFIFAPALKAFAVVE